MLRTRLWECNLLASGKKAALIECLQQSASLDEPGTQHEQPADSATQQAQPTDCATQQTRPADRTDNSTGNNPRAVTTESTR